MENGFGPTVREICRGLGLASPGSLMKHLKALEDQGLLSRAPGKNRTFKVAGLEHPSPTIPLLGRIAAGTPILALENREADLPVDPALFGCDVTFALQVRGDSMIDAHIMDGDLAVIQPAEEAPDGQVVAVMVEGAEDEAALKILRRPKGRIELHAANPAHDPLVFEGADRSRIRILGRLVGVIRSGSWGMVGVKFGRG
jgi:repressor LexA